MMVIREYLRGTFVGIVMRIPLRFLYGLHDLIFRKKYRFDLRTFLKGKYRYWRSKWYSREHIKSERQLLEKARQRQEVYFNTSDHNPLVSVLIPTWNRGQLLISRTLPTVLNQTYRNLEIIIVGDCCTDSTAALIASLEDSRIHFLNLPERGKYPSEKKALWQVAGSAPKNMGLDLCRGDWIAPLDDDDVFTPDHVESLLQYAQKNNLELVYGKLRIEEAAGRWNEKGLVNEHMSIQNSTMIFRSYLKLFKSDIDAWRVGLPVDYHRTVRYRETGVRIGYLNKVVALMPLRPGQTKTGFLADDRPVIEIINAV